MKTSKPKLAVTIFSTFVAPLLLLTTNLGAKPAPDRWQTPIKVPINDRVQISTSKYLAAVIFGKVGKVSRVVVMQPSGATERRLLNGEALYPGEKCFVYFDGVPEPGDIVSIPTPIEGDHCRPQLWNLFVRAWGVGSGTGAEVYLCESNTDYNENGTPFQPCCRIMPGGCKGGGSGTPPGPPPSAPMALVLNSSWITTQVHTFGRFSGQSINVRMVVKEVSGSRITVQFDPPFGEYALRGEMKRNVFTFEIFRSGAHHGRGTFTFTGNAFEGEWSDDWQNGGTWRGHASRTG